VEALGLVYGRAANLSKLAKTGCASLITVIAVFITLERGSRNMANGGGMADWTERYRDQHAVCVVPLKGEWLTDVRRRGVMVPPLRFRA
jgi:hypothetical protein